MVLLLSPERIYGPLALGVLFASFFSGVTTLQVVVYFRLYPRDLKFLRPTVLTIWILDLLHTALIWEVVWFYMVKGFGDRSKLRLSHFGISASCIVTALIMFITHLFYVYRIFRLSKKYWLSALILFLASVAVSMTLRASCISSTSTYVHTRISSRSRFLIDAAPQLHSVLL